MQMQSSTLARLSEQCANLRLRRASSVLLLALLVAGLATKWLLCQNLALTSDSVGPGLVAMEIGKHGNFLLSGYHLPSADTYLFTEILPFHLLPQVLTGYDPTALKAVSYGVFLLVVLVGSLLVYLSTKSGACSLIFAALAASIDPLPFTLFATPANHIGTMFWVLALLCLSFAANPLPEPGQAPKKPVLLSAALLLVLTFLVAFSDTIVFAWFVVPYVLASLLLSGRQAWRSIAIPAGVALAAIAAYALKTCWPGDYATASVGLTGAAELLSGRLQLLLQCLAALLAHGPGAVPGGAWLALLGGAALLALLVLAVPLAWRLADPRARFLAVLLALAVLTTAIAFVITGYAENLSGSRYLTFPAIALYGLVALAYRGCGDRLRLLYAALLAVFLAVSLIFSGASLLSLSPDPDGTAHELILSLESQGLTDGYGTYWAANLLTYLSSEQVTVRPVAFIDGGMAQYAWNSCDRWYDYSRRDTFLVADPSTLTPLDRSDLEVTMGQLQAEPPAVKGTCLIYRLPQYRLSKVLSRDTPQGIEYYVE